MTGCSILYVGSLAEGQTCLYRYHALERLGHRLIPFDMDRYVFKQKTLSALRFRFPMGPLIAGVNAALLDAVKKEKPDVVWMDKPIDFTAATIKRIRALGAQTVDYNQDNPFGPRNDGCWHQFYKSFRSFDLHCLLRNADIPRYKGWGLNYLKIQLSYDPVVHFPPPKEWSDQDQPRGASYIGHPHEDRANFLRTLIEREKLPVVISGSGWLPVMVGEERARYTSAGILQDAQGMLKGKDYREAIWKSKINLSFVTLLNEEDVAHKAFEITACGGFLLAFRTPGHLACFEEGKEAEFFSTVEECAEKVRYYLAHPAERAEIARRGCERAKRSGYDNDTQLGLVLSRLEEMRHT